MYLGGWVCLLELFPFIRFGDLVFIGVFVGYFPFISLKDLFLPLNGLCPHCILTPFFMFQCFNYLQLAWLFPFLYDV